MSIVGEKIEVWQDATGEGEIWTRVAKGKMYVFKRLRGRKNMMIGVYLSALVCGKKCVSLERKKEKQKEQKVQRKKEKRDGWRICVQRKKMCFVRKFEAGSREEK